MLKRMSYQLAPEEEVPGGGGVQGPDSPPGDHNPNPPQDDAPPDDLGGEQPRGGAEDADERRAAPRERQENAIPHSRVKEMLRQAQQQAYIAAQSDLENRLRPFIADLRQQVEGGEARVVERIATALGKPPPKPPPRYLTEEDLNRKLSEQEARHQARLEELERSRETRQSADQAEREMEALRSKYPEVFEADPDLEEDIADKWSSRRAAEAGWTVTQVGEALVKRVRERQAKLSAGVPVEDEREAPAARPTPISPGRAGRPAPRRPNLGNDEVARQAALTLLSRRGVR